MKLRAATCTDGYKVSHGPMYRNGTTKVYSNLTPRSDRIYRKTCTKFYDGKLVYVGGQGALQEITEMWNDSFFHTTLEIAVGRFKRRMLGYLGTDIEATKQLTDLYLLGYLPIRVKSLKEGSKVGMGVPVLIIENTDKRFYWLVNYLETVLSDLIWKPSTTATIAAEYKAICKHYAELTGTDDFTVSIQCHDFSMRGMSGPEDAARSGFGHLVSFYGTDTLPAMDYAEVYYDADPDSLIAMSVPATEHAVATSNILAIEKRLIENGVVGDTRLVAETMFMKHLITKLHPTGVVSYVADSFDFWSVITKVLPSLKEVIMSREAAGPAPGKLVVRPDSGNPVRVICGYEVYEEVLGDGKELDKTDIYASQDFDGWWWLVRYGKIGWERYQRVTEAEVKGAVQCLWETFGGTITEKGFKMLDSHIGLIYGDSITVSRCAEILERLAQKMFASGNVVFGVGSYTYQCITRDTFGFAVKATYTEVGDECIDIFKDPKTDSKKKSARGMLRVDMDDAGEYVLIDSVTRTEEEGGCMEVFYENGKFVKRVTLEDIRKQASM